MRAAATAAVLVAGVVVATGFVPDSAATVPAAMQGAGAAPVAAAEPDVCGTARGASTAAGLTAEQTLVARAGVASAERNGVGKDGAVIVIAIIENLMNLTGIEPSIRQMVFGCVLLVAIYLASLQDRFALHASRN